MNGIRSVLYRWARVLGDVQSVRKGPRAVVRRQVRKTAYRTSNRAVSRAMRRIGAE